MDKSEKARRNAIKREIRENEKTAILSTLPISIEKLNELFVFLDEELGTNACDNTLLMTDRFIARNQLPKVELSDWLRSNGGYCDCEVVLNVEGAVNE